MRYNSFYTAMPDGTVKQINPFTGTEVWAIPGRKSKPITNEIPSNAKKIEKKEVDDYCSFCSKKYFETPPERARLIRQDSRYVQLTELPADQYFNTVAEFRRVANLFEIVSIDYWRKNYNYKIPEWKARWKEEYLSRPAGAKHVLDILQYKLKRSELTPEQIDQIPMEQKLLMADGFFGGAHELVIARHHYKDGAEWDSELFSSGEMTQEEHYQYFRFTIEAMRDILNTNRYARYISIFQNWLRPSGASFDHLHKQLVGLDEWGASIERQTKMLQENPNVFNDYGVNFAAMYNLIFAENDYAIAYVGIGHRFPTIEVFSKSSNCRPYEHTDEEIRGVSNLVHACHAAMGSQISCNEEWSYSPVDAVYKMPWHILIKWRINVPAGFEGGTNIYINPMHPIEMRDRLVPRLYALRDRGVVNSFRVAEECRIYPNTLKYYLR
jgi:galactose-1-phosphate uridylyltransferase